MRSLVALITGRRTKYLILAVWLVATVAVAGFAGKLQSVERNDLASYLPAGAESTQVAKAQTAFGSADTLPAVVVYQRTTGLTGADRAKIRADARAFGRRTDLEGAVVGPTLSADGTAAQIVVPLDLGPDSFNRAADAVTAIRRTARQDTNGLSTHVAGPAGATADQSAAFGGIDSTLLVATIAVVVAILLLTYRSPVLWLLPVLSAGLALTGAQAAIYLLARYAHLAVTGDSGAVLTILVFGAATDYALLLIARYREELHRNADRHQAMAMALRHCAPPIVASALTVVAAMLCLPLADLQSTRSLGPVLAVGVLISLVVMLTLFPALLVSTGQWIFWPARPRYATAERAAAAGWWHRLGNRIARRPRLTWVATALVLGTLALGVTQLDATGFTSDESFRGRPDSVAGDQVLAHQFTAGTGTPIVVVSRPDRADDVRAAVAATRGVDAGSLTPSRIQGNRAYLEATLTDPAGSQAAYHAVDRVRAAVHAVPRAGALVGGDTAVQLDIQRTARGDRNLLMPIVFAVVFAILVLLLRSLVAPLLLIATVVLSYGAALGASAFAFRHVFGFAGEDSSLPLFLFVFLVALGVDYNIFLMTRIREEAAVHGTRAATLLGLASTGSVITSAGLVLAGTFAVLTTLPLTVVIELGLAVTFGILLDTFVVRSILVTALSLDVGRYLWWPGRLFRVAPRPPGTRPATPLTDAVRPGQPA